MAIDINDTEIDTGTRVRIQASGHIVHVHSNGRVDVKWDGSPVENSVDANLLELESEERIPEPGPDGRWYHEGGTPATDLEAANAIWGSMPLLDLDKLEALARAASPGLWEAEVVDSTLELNKGTALTEWNADRTVGKPARSWRSTDKLIELDLEDYGEDEIDALTADVDYIAAARPDVVLALIQRVRAAEAARVTPEQRDLAAEHFWNQMVGVAKSAVVQVMDDAFLAAGISVTRSEGTRA